MEYLFDTIRLRKYISRYRNDAMEEFVASCTDAGTVTDKRKFSSIQAGDPYWEASKNTILNQDYSIVICVCARLDELKANVNAFHNDNKFNNTTIIRSAMNLYKPEGRVFDLVNNCDGRYVYFYSELDFRELAETMMWQNDAEKSNPYLRRLAGVKTGIK